MAAREKKRASGAAAVLLPADMKKKSVPVWLARNPGWLREAPLSEAQRTWAEAQGFKAAARKHVLLPEMNTGQLLMLLRSMYLVDIKPLTKVRGQPFTITEIKRGIKQILAGETPMLAPIPLDTAAAAGG
jgi:hypothetical protein